MFTFGCKSLYWKLWEVKYFKRTNLLHHIMIFFSQSNLFQEAEKPSIYTKISCFLPWIAEEYDMDFSEKVEDKNDECSVGSGIDDFNAEECRCLCLGNLLCIFPFYFNGKLYENCAFLEYQDFLVQGPIYRCPVRNITRKIDGINSFTQDDFIKQVTSYTGWRQISLDYVAYVHCTNINVLLDNQWHVCGRGARSL